MKDWAQSIAQVTDNPFEALLSHKIDPKRKKSEGGAGGGGGGEGGGTVYGDMEKLQGGCMQLMLWFVFLFFVFFFCFFFVFFFVFFFLFFFLFFFFVVCFFFFLFKSILFLFPPPPPQNIINNNNNSSQGKDELAKHYGPTAKMRPPIEYLNYYYRTIDKQKQQYIVIDGQSWGSADQLQSKVRRGGLGGRRGKEIVVFIVIIID